MYLVAFLVGMYGYLFPGNINIMLMELYSNRRNSLLFFVFLLALVFEFTYCFIALTFCNWFGNNITLMRYLTISGCLLSLGFGVWILVGSKQATKDKQMKATIARGVISIIIHPQQIPFWLFVFVQLKAFVPVDNVALFSIFNSLGCATIFACYTFGGNKFVSLLRLNMSTVKKAVGFLYIFSAIATLLRMGAG